MKLKTLFCAVALLCAVFAQAQLSWTYDLKQHTASPTLLVPTGLRVEQFLGTKLDLDIVALGGARMDGGALFGGFGASVPVKLGRNLSADLGLFVTFEASKPVSGGFLLGFRM